jgi:predicted enzyme related to lactoylglutathione lyase
MCTKNNNLVETPFLGLRTIVYNVNNLQAAKRYYTKVLGQLPYFDEPYYVGYNVAGYELGLMPAEEGAPAAASTTYWGVQNVQKAYDNLLDEGAQPFDPPHGVGDDIVLASVQDPGGNIFGIIYNPHFKLPA